MDEYYAHGRQEMMKFVPERRQRVLEVGCGEGRFTASIQGVQESWGIEPSEAAAAAGTRLNRVLNAGFETALPELPPRYFDVVVCNDVIEHFVDHDAFLEQIKQVIAPGGVLVGSIPNVRHYVNLFDVLVGRDWAYQDMGVMDRTHLRFFTERSLQRTLMRHGYRIEAFQGINSGIQWRHCPLRYPLFAVLALTGTFGYFSDIRHLQFGFRVSVA